MSGCGGVWLLTRHSQLWPAVHPSGALGLGMVISWGLIQYIRTLHV